MHTRYVFYKRCAHTHSIYVFILYVFLKGVRTRTRARMSVCPVLLSMPVEGGVEGKEKAKLHS